MHGFTSMAKIVSASSSVEVFAKAKSIATYGIVVVVQNPLRCGQSLASTRTHLVHHAWNSRLLTESVINCCILCGFVKMSSCAASA